jgi:hypothetical protein
MHPSPTTPRPARPGAPRHPLGAVAAPCLRLALEVLLLTLLAALLGPRRLARAWRDAQAPLPTDLAGYEFEPQDSPAPFRVRSIHDGTHLVCEHPILYVIGPGPNLGLRPLPRALPPSRPRIARAPPRPSARPKSPHPRQTAPNRGTIPHAYPTSRPNAPATSSAPHSIVAAPTTISA